MKKWDEATLVGWKEQEKQFKKDVVDMSKHKTLVNPYDLERLPGKRRAMLAVIGRYADRNYRQIEKDDDNRAQEGDTG